MTRRAVSSRIDSIDALRALAAISVMLYHYTTRYGERMHDARLDGLAVQVPWGHYGVELFFVISGFVIGLTLANSARLADFARSRFSRLFPGYWAAVGLTYGVLTLAGMPDWHVTTAQAAVNLTMLQRFVHQPAVEGVYWTLSVELLFYAWMALLWFTRLRGVFMPALAAWVAYAGLWAAKVPVLGHASDATVVYLLLDHIHFFAAGMALFRWREGLMGRGTLALWLLGAVVVGGLHGGAPEAMAAAIAASLVLAALGPWAHWLSWRGVLPSLGVMSYSLYLLHQYMGYLAIRSLLDHGVNAGLAVACVIVGMVAASALFSAAIERPGSRWLKNLLRPRPAAKVA